MPTIRLRVSEENRDLETSAVDADYLEQLNSELRETDAVTIHITLDQFDRWTPDDQSPVWELCKVICRNGHQLRLTVDDCPYDDPLAATIGRLVVGDNIDRHASRLQSAINAVRVFCPEVAYDAAATRILDRLDALGVHTRQTTVLKWIREAASTTEEPATASDLTLAAEDFQAHLSERFGDTGDDEQKVLHYFNGQFYIFRRGYWKEVSSKEFQALVTQFLQGRDEFTQITQKLVSDVIQNLTGQTVVACGEEPLPFLIEDYGAPARIQRRQLLVFQNGMVDVGTVVEGETTVLLRFDSKWFSTVGLPYEFNAEARCPRFMQFLYHILNVDPETGTPQRCDDRRIEVLQEYFGYCLLNHGRFQRFLIMFGDGNNGKSVVLHLLTAMLGRENCSHVGLDQLRGTFGLQPLLGKTANICGDLNELNAVAEGVLKQLTGEDNVTVQRKHRDSISMAPAIKLIFSTNTLPVFKDRTRGVWRRLIAMPFEVDVQEDEQDANLATDLEAELPGILNWAIQGLQRLLQQQGFTPCQVCDDAKSQHQRDCDPFEQFLDECVEVRTDAQIDKPDLYKLYKDWCEENNRKPLASGSFARRVAKIERVSIGRHTGGRRYYYFTGITGYVARPAPAPPARPAPSVQLVQNSSCEHGRMQPS